MQDTTETVLDGTGPRSAPFRAGPLPTTVRPGRAPRARQDVLVFSRYADVSAIARDPAFMSKDAEWFDARLPGWRQSAGMRLFGSSMMFHNGAGHQRLRSAMSPAFGAARLRALREVVRTAVEHRIGLLDERPRGATVDVHEQFTLPVTRSTVCALLGAPEEEGPLLHALVQPLLALVDPEIGLRRLTDANRAARTLRPHLDRLIAEDRTHPGGGLVTSVAGALDDDEAASALTLALAAGFDTTLTLLDYAISALMASPARASVASGEAAAVDAAVNEALRLCPPVRLITRVARHEVTVGGIRVPAGQEVMALIAEAHRDPEHFPDPDAFRPGRPASRLLAFGAGPHYCLGAQLARLEASLVLPALLRRFPRISAVGVSRPNDLVNLRGWADLPVVLDP